MKIFAIQQKKLGSSLLELLVYVTILSGLVIVSSNMFVSLSKGQGQSQARSEVDSAVRFANELMRQDLKNSSSVSVPALGTPSATLSLVRAGTTIIYDVSGGVLRRKEGVAAPVNVTNTTIVVGTPQFTRIENTNTVFNTTITAVKINISFSYAGSSPDWSYSTSLRTSINVYP